MLVVSIQLTDVRIMQLESRIVVQKLSELKAHGCKVLGICIVVGLLHRQELNPTILDTIVELVLRATAIPSETELAHVFD